MCVICVSRFYKWIIEFKKIETIIFLKINSEELCDIFLIKELCSCFDCIIM